MHSCAFVHAFMLSLVQYIHAFIRALCGGISLFAFPFMLSFVHCVAVFPFLRFRAVGWRRYFDCRAGVVISILMQLNLGASRVRIAIEKG